MAIQWRHLLPLALLGAPHAGVAAPLFSAAGDGTFRNIVASGGTLGGVDLSASTATTAGGVSRPLASRFADAVNGADYGMKCNGTADDTAGLEAALAAATARSGGAELDLPGGTCRISAEIDVAASSSLGIRGRGNQATTLQWTADTNGLVVTLSNGSGLTLRGLAIGKASGTNGGTVFDKTAISVAPYAPAGASFASMNANGGEIAISDVNIEGTSEAGQTDGWAVGLHLVNTHTASVYDLKDFMPGFPAAGTGGGAALTALPSPTNQVATPASLGPGIADGILVEGSNSFAIDTSIIDCTVTGGLVGYEIGGYVQGVYGLNNRAVANVYGVRAIVPNTSGELIDWIGFHANDVVGGLYIDGFNENAIVGGLLLHDNGGIAAPQWTGIWSENSGETNISSTTVTGLGSASPQTEEGIAFSATAAGGFAGFPDTANGNIFNPIDGIGIGSDANTTALTAIGNSFANVVTPWSDQNGSNQFAANQIAGINALHEDTSRNYYFPTGVQSGSQYDAGALYAMNGTVRAGTWSATGVDQNGGNDAVYTFVAEGHSTAVASGATASTFYVSPGGGAPSSNGAAVAANLLIPSTVTLQRGVVRAKVDCNNGSTGAEDWNLVRDFGNYAPIGNGTYTIENSTASGNAEQFGLSFSIGRDATTGSPTVVGTVASPSSGTTPALICSARIETEITY